MGRGKQLTEEQQKKMIADYVATGSYSEAARLNNTSPQSVRKYVRADPSFADMLHQKQKEITQGVLEHLQRTSAGRIRLLDKIFAAAEEKVDNLDMFTTFKDLMTGAGILIDKEVKLLELERERRDRSDDSSLAGVIEVAEVLPEVEDA